jgi:hypothetical protein
MVVSREVEASNATKACEVFSINDITNVLIQSVRLEVAKVIFSGEFYYSSHLRSREKVDSLGAFRFKFREGVLRSF